MKIAQIIYGVAGGGAPNVALSLVEKLQEKKHTVHLIRVNVSYDNKKEKEIIKELDNKKIRHFILDRTPKEIGFHSIYKLYKILKKEQYDVVHSHLLIPDIYSALVNLFLFNKFQHIITVHSTAPYHNDFFLSTIFRKSNFVRCSPAIKKIKSIKKDFIIPNGIDIEKFKPNNTENRKIREELNLDNNSILLVSIGNLRVEKNQITGIEMMDIIVNKKHYKNIHYLICGQGDTERDLKSKIIELNLTKHVHFLGLRNDIPVILKECNYFFNFSLWEGLPLAVIEAFASGITTVLSPIVEHRAISSEITQCYVLENNIAESFASTLENLLIRSTVLTHEEIFIQRESALKRYSSRSFTDSYEKLFMGLLKNA